MTTANDLFKIAYSLPYGSAAKRDALLAAIDAADAEGDIELGFSGREDYISASWQAPNTTQQIAAFAWCLARQDEDPDRFSVDMWYYKWVASAMLKSVQIPKEQMSDVLDDMERRYRAENASQAPVLEYRIGWAKRFEPEAVADLFEQWRLSDRRSRARQNDCTACNQATEARIWQFLGHYERALEAAEPLLKGKSSCAGEPEYGIGEQLESFRRLGLAQSTEAKEALVKGLRRLERRSEPPAELIGHYARHLAIEGDLKRASNLVSSHFPETRIDDQDWLDYTRGARLTLLAADRDGVTLRNLEPRREEILDGAEAMAEAFDRSEQRSYNSQLLDSDEKELQVSPG